MADAPSSQWILLFAGPVALLLTQIVMALAHWRGWVAKPKADRWHSKPTALFGGVAIFTTFALGSLGLLGLRLFAGHYDLLGLLLGGAIIFGVGLRDDIKPLNPLVKLVGQVMAVMPFLVGLLLSHNSVGFILSTPLVLLWMLTLTNSFNLLDNMDGLSAGTAALVALILAFHSRIVAMPLLFLLSVLTAASCLGFLVFNFRPKGSAKIFMGDCGSMFLGYVLSGLTVLGVSASAPSPTIGFIVPVLLMAVPLFDTILVIIIRRREGRAISQGGKDHSSHRLVYAGCNEKQAVLILFLLTLLFGDLGIGLEAANQSLLPVVLPVVLLALTWFGIYLNQFSKPRPASEPTPLPNREPQFDPIAAVRQE